ncbi:B-cell linker protein isoform X2 [Corythoichthys intestinalis]|nr:B-cell linker protein isoform X2 [Corythoichthys intestinalis]XP_057703862.1 B-cell linker protein isoform X2 [Corythoichthys intestinalis]
MVGPEMLSESEYDNDIYDNPRQVHNINYEPPPSHRVFTRTLSSSLPAEAYLDGCNYRPNLEHRKAVKRSKEPQRSHPQPTHMGSNDDDYINPDGSNEDDNYVVPAENPPSAFCDTLGKEEHQAESDSKYTVGDHVDTSSHGTGQQEPAPFYSPKPMPRLLPEPPLRHNFECRKLPMIHTDRRPHPPKFPTLDMKQSKIPLPNVSFLEQTESHSDENWTKDQNKDADIYEKPWFAGECDRKTADQLLFHANEDGAFMVRKSSGQDINQPYTLVVYYHGKVYNIPIRFIHTRQQYALGTEKKTEVYFHSVSHIIEKHQKKPLVLIDSKSNSKGAVMLCFPPKRPTTSGHHHTSVFSPSLQNPRGPQVTWH